MEIEFVNHASFILSVGTTRLLADPWIEGYAFYDGWALVSPTRFQFADFATITHIWFSHEHPDHFSPANIKSIPAEYRKNITVLYQYTKDKKIIQFCKDAGFKQVIELNAQWVEITDGIELYNKPHTDGDSWLVVKADGKTIANLNDCIFDSAKELEEVKAVCGKVDVLFTQFSYAAWTGNKGNIDAQKAQAQRKLNEINRQAGILKPTYIIPFASYIWFCHEDNFYLNEGANRITYVNEFIKGNTNATPVVLFTGDKWEVGNPYNSSTAIANWEKAFDEVLTGDTLVKNKTVTVDELRMSAAKFGKLLLQNNSAFINMLKPAKIYVTDLEKAFTYTLKGGLQPAAHAYDSCDIALSADALNYSFKFMWGGATIRVNGRYQAPVNGNYNNIKMYFLVSQMNNFGQRFNLPYIVGVVAHKLKAKVLR